jgi:hypothetical protein
MHWEADTSLIDTAREIAPIIQKYNQEAERERRLSRRFGKGYGTLNRAPFFGISQHPVQFLDYKLAVTCLSFKEQFPVRVSVRAHLG